ncbi:MAG: hypothetical protein FWG99_12215 [Treponema sp.]|nr:hypothetical protein [Treponema sp.]
MTEALTFEKVWAMFQETDKKFQESDRKFQEAKAEREEAERVLREERKEADRKYKEEREEANRKYKEEKEEADRKYKEEREEADRKYKEEREEANRKLEKQMKETDRRIGELGNRFGELAEHLVAPSIMEKFNDLGFEFSEHLHNWQIKDPNNPAGFTEIDILLGNGDIAIAIEVKAKPRRAAVDEHIHRMEILRKVADRRKDTRKYQGALAGAIMEEPVRQYALEKGLYVIEQTGDTVMINVPKGFTAREW